MTENEGVTEKIDAQAIPKDNLMQKHHGSSSVTTSDQEDENHLARPNTSSIDDHRSDSFDLELPSKRPRTQDEKKLDRILANRRSARKSRERRKTLQENLEKSVLLLTRQNEDLQRENQALKNELRVLINVFNEKQRTVATPGAAIPGFPGGNAIAGVPGADTNNLNMNNFRQQAAAHHQLQQQLTMANAAASNPLFQNANAFNPAVLAALQQQQQQQQQSQQNRTNVQDFLIAHQQAGSNPAAGMVMYGQNTNPVTANHPGIFPGQQGKGNNTAGI